MTTEANGGSAEKAASGAETSEVPPEVPPEEPKEFPGKDLRELIDSEFPGAVLEQSAYNDLDDEVTFVLRPDSLMRVCAFLRDHPSSRFNLLADLTAAHYPDNEGPFEVIYQLYSIDDQRRVRLKVKTQAEVPSVTEVWSGANWMEREVWDLFGISFQHHPDLRRILLPENWGSHPLRKDYPLEGRGERVYTKPKRKEIGE